MVGTSGVVVITEYFVRLRPMAFSLSLAGLGIGNMVFPMVSTVFIENLGWRGKCLKSISFAWTFVSPCKWLIVEDSSKINVSQDDDNSYIKIDCSKGEVNYSHVNIVKLLSQ